MPVVSLRSAALSPNGAAPSPQNFHAMHKPPHHHLERELHPQGATPWRAETYLVGGVVTLKPKVFTRVTGYSTTRTGVTGYSPTLTTLPSCTPECCKINGDALGHDLNMVGDPALTPGAAGSFHRSNGLPHYPYWRCGVTGYSSHTAQSAQLHPRTLPIIKGSILDHRDAAWQRKMEGLSPKLMVGTACATAWGLSTYTPCHKSCAAHALPPS
jgi:hypothetical protein